MQDHKEGKKTVHQELWQQEKQRLASTLQEKILGHREEALYRDLLRQDLPEFFQVYLRNQARKIFQDERPVRLRATSRYDLEDPQLKRQLLALRDTVINGTLFTREELAQIVQAAVNIQFDVLVRPRQTMEHMLFRNHQERNLSDIIVIVQGFGEDRPFVRELLIELRGRADRQIDAETFHRLAIEIEDRIYSIKPISTFLQDLTGYQQFEKKITGVQEDRVSGVTVRGMLTERRLEDLNSGLRIESENKKEWPLNEIEAALERILLTRGVDAYGVEAGVESEEDLPGDIDLEEVLEESPLPVDFKPGVRMEAFGDVAEDEEDERKPEPGTSKVHEADFEQPRMRLAEEEAHVEPQSTEQYDFEEHEESNQQQPKTNKLPTIIFGPEEHEQFIDRDTIERQPPGPYPPLHTLIDARSRKMIMRKIFRRNKEEYVAFVEQLEHVDTWKEAKSLIDLELHRRGISPYSKEAVRLGDILFSRYFSRKRR